MRYTQSILSFLLYILPFCSFAGAYELAWFQKPSRPHFYELESADDFAGLVMLVNTEGMTFLNDTISIKNDLDLSGAKSLTSFSGTILGNGKRISSMTAPLISTLSANGSVNDLIFDNTCQLKSGIEIGVVAGKCSGAIKNCISYAGVDLSSSAYFRIGGIVGTLSKGKIYGCVNYGKLSGTVPAKEEAVMRIGGICAYADGKSEITGCSNYGTIIAKAYANAIAGGIVADAQYGSVIENCFNHGKVNSSITGTATLTSWGLLQYTGGIAGQIQNGAVINRCKNFGAITNNTQHVAGICANVAYGSIVNCTNHGKIESENNYFYSCASGICGYFSGVNLDNNAYLLNNLNTGEIISRTQNAVATAAGICANIKFGYVGNLLNLGTTMASATGYNRDDFVIEQYETTDSSILSEISSVEEANRYVEDYVGQWDLIQWNVDNDMPDLNNGFLYYVETFQGCAKIVCLSDSSGKEYRLDDRSGSLSPIIFTDNTLIGNLSPSSSYSFNLTDIESGLSFPIQISTSAIGIDLNIEDIDFTSVKLEINPSATGCTIDESGIKIRPSASYEWSLHKAYQGSVVVDNLADNTTYDIRPYLIFGEREYDGDYASFTTPDLIPMLILTDNTSTTASFNTQNPSALSGYTYGLIIDGEQHLPDEEGHFLIQDLKCDRAYECEAFIEKKDSTFRYPVTTFTPVNFETGETLQISPTAAMIIVRVGRNIMEDYPNYPYNEYKVEFKSVNDPDASATVPEGLTPVYIGNTYEYATTFPFSSSDMQQYRLRTETKEDRWNKKKYLYGEWEILNPTQPDVEVVRPLFRNIQSALTSKGLTLSCSNVAGEESITEYGLEYRLTTAQDYIPLPLTADKGQLSHTFTSLVKGLQYVGRFYNKVLDRVYYSENFLFDAEGGLTMTDETEAPDPQEQLHLSILYPENGIVDQLVDYHSNVDFTITAPDSWLINSIHLNDERLPHEAGTSYAAVSTGPITKDSHLNITFCKNISVDSPAVTPDDRERLIVYSSGNKLYLEGVEPLPSFTVADVEGHLIYQGRESCVILPTPGIYLVKSESAVYKLLIHF